MAARMGVKCVGHGEKLLKVAVAWVAAMLSMVEPLVARRGRACGVHGVGRSACGAIGVVWRRFLKHLDTRPRFRTSLKRLLAHVMAPLCFRRNP